MALGRDAILKSDDLPREEVPVPEWGGTVFVRAMTGIERERFESAPDKSPNMVRALLAVMTVCDEQGNPVFGNADIPALGAKSAAALIRVAQVAMRLSKARAADLEELEGKSAPSPSASS